MPDWLIVWLGHLQGGILRSLAGELRSGGIATVWLAGLLGALHALTPGHGKAALAAYFLGREAHIGKGVRVALTASIMHVLSGFAIFLLLKFVLHRAPSMLGRPSPSFTIVGYALIILAGAVMIAQSFGSRHQHGAGTHALTAGIGLLPCPLTILVLGFAWSQGSPGMVLVVLLSLALGISLTIGLVALTAIVARRTMGAALAGYLPGLDRWSRVLQVAAGVLIVTVGIATITPLILRT